MVAAFKALGWKTISLGRRPTEATAHVPFDLASTEDLVLPSSLTALVHCAYDERPVRRRDIWSVNVAGTERLLSAAQRAGIERIVVISSIGAFEGSRQIYGQAKLAIERIAHRRAVVVRPGLLWSAELGGIVGALTKLLRLPLVPVPAAHSWQYPAHVDDVVACVVALTMMQNAPQLVTVAHPDRIAVLDLVRLLREISGSSSPLIPVPWRPVYGVMRLIEASGVRLPLRADSLFGLAHPPPPPSGAPIPGVERLRPIDDLQREPLVGNAE